MKTTTPTAKQILAFESKTWRYSGAKERAIAETFGMPAVAYYAALFEILEEPDPAVAVEFGPLIARRRRQLAKGLAARRARRAA